MPHTRERILQATILVVEDNHGTLLMIEQSLRKHGFHSVVGAENGHDALNKLKTMEPDLIITDLMMPHVDGFTLCQEIRNHPHLCNIPILALTALENEKARLTIFDMGASDLVRKPVTEEELIARCRIHLEKRYILKDLQDYRHCMEEDLGNARAMQNLLMPDCEAIAQVEKQYGMGISSLFAPSFTIGGDFWGMRPLPNDKLAIYIGDFTGHGVTAAINVFRLCTLMDRINPQLSARPASFLNQLNRQLHATLPIQLFATMFYGVLDPQKNRLTYCVAGCPPPLKIHSNGRYELLGGSGLPVAAINSTEYREYKCDFLANDALVLYSDALIETADKNGDYLQIDNIAKVLTQTPGTQRNAADMLKIITSLFSDYTAQGLEDDLTLNVYMRHS